MTMVPPNGGLVALPDLPGRDEADECQRAPAPSKADMMSTRTSAETSATRAMVAGAEPTTSPVVRYTAAAIRLSIGWVFLWVFLDKLFGLGHDTVSKAAWIHGGSLAQGFLAVAAKSPYKGMYNDFAGQAWADWLFMIGLLGIGVALMLGIAMRPAAAWDRLPFVQQQHWLR
jgi:thiosulfate dehydrogenase [quinone] large subunit